MDIKQEFNDRENMEDEVLPLVIAALLAVDLSVATNGVADAVSVEEARSKLEEARRVGWNYVVENAATDEASRSVGSENDSEGWSAEAVGFMTATSAEIAAAAKDGADRFEQEAIARNVLADRREARAKSYAIEAVNGAVEKAKWVVMVALGFVLTVDKTWRNAGDNRVRKSHVAAHGQTVAFYEPFTVGGFALMFPKDPSAPLGETANCRCGVEYSISWSKKNASKRS